MNEIKKRIQSFNNSIIWGAEKNCWPFVMSGDSEFCKKYPSDEHSESFYSKTKYTDLNEKAQAQIAPRYLNSGLVVGRADELISFFEESMKLFKGGMADDQEIASRIFASRKFSATLDYGSLLFQNMHESLRDLDTVNGRFHNHRMDVVPAIIHFNGDKSHLQEFQDRMWYDRPEYAAEVNSEIEGYYTHDLEFINFSKVCRK